jgi:hypothetical protein
MTSAPWPKLVPTIVGDLRAIETEYRGYRFRSRTEARYAVLFDAAGIAWQYEVEGFELGGARYLPDFYLPELKIYVEVKATQEAAAQAAKLLWQLHLATGCEVLFAIGSPTIEPPDNFFTCTEQFGGRGYNVDRADIGQCPFCTQLHFTWKEGCHCAGDVRVLWMPRCAPLRLIHALGEAQRARFEFGETGRPQPYRHPPAATKLDIYVAGAIFCKEHSLVDAITADCPVDARELDPWRLEIFHCEESELTKYQAPSVGRLVYAGPTIFLEHGLTYEGLAKNCLAEVEDADALFAWIDREDTVGTMVEIGAAYTVDKPIFIAFANDALADRFYFVRQLATVAVITGDVTAAWKLFAQWQSNGVP